MITTLPARADVDELYRNPDETYSTPHKQAEASLREGRETVVHSHTSFAQVEHHRHCDWYVLDWHDDPPAGWAGMRQIVVIECPPLDGDA